MHYFNLVAHDNKYKIQISSRINEGLEVPAYFPAMTQELTSAIVKPEWNAVLEDFYVRERALIEERRVYTNEIRDIANKKLLMYLRKTHPEYYI